MMASRDTVELARPRSHALGIIPAHIPSTPATNTTRSSILLAASYHQPARTERSQAVTSREHAQSAQHQPPTPSLAPPRPPSLTASCGCLCAVISGPEGGGNDHLALVLRLLELGHDEHLVSICLSKWAEVDDVAAPGMMHVVKVSSHQVVGRAACPRRGERGAAGLAAYCAPASPRPSPQERAACRTEQPSGARAGGLVPRARGRVAHGWSGLGGAVHVCNVERCRVTTSRMSRGGRQRRAHRRGALSEADCTALDP